MHPDHLFPGEDPALWHTLHQHWLAEFTPATPLLQDMVLRAAQADWDLRRELQRTHQLEAALLAQQLHPAHWTPDQHKRLTWQRRQRRNAELRLHSLRAAIEARQRARRPHELHTHRPQPAPAEPARKPIPALGPPPGFLQVVIVQVHDGVTRTIYNPDNEIMQRVIAHLGHDGRPIVRTLRPKSRWLRSARTG